MIRVAFPDLGPEEERLVAEVLASGQLVQGAMVARFEALVAARVGVPHAIAVSSGTAALHLGLLALGVGPGDEVIVPDYTFPATANVVERCGARPVLVDIRLDDYCVDPALVEPAITPRTRALMPVHLFGRPAAMAALHAIGLRHGLPLIEDAACALGSALPEGACGALGMLGCFSFHARKIITTGEGGMITTADARLAAQLRLLRDHGLVRTPLGGSFVLAGLNYRMTELQAALGVAQMGRLDTLLARRRAIAALYRELLAGLPGLLLPDGPGHAYQSYAVLLPAQVDRDQVLTALRARGVEASIGTYSVGAQPHYQDRASDCPRSRLAFARVVSLPIHTRLSDDEVRAVAQALRALLPLDAGGALRQS